MKKLLRSLGRNESGQGVLITVLVLLILGALLIVPLLNLMGTGLQAGRVNEERTEEFYAADAGVEDALYKLVNKIDIELLDYTYYLPDINGKEVQVTLPSQRDVIITFFKDIGVLDPEGQGDYNKNRPHAEWLVVYSPIETETGVYGEYRITVYYNGTPPRDVLSTGFWILNYDGTTEPITYDPDEDGWVWIDLDGDGINGTGEWIHTDGSLIDDFPGEFRVADKVGNAFIWEWDINEGPTFGSDVICRTQRFALVPNITVAEGRPLLANVAWVETKTDDIQISWYGSTGFCYIISTATDPYTLKHTTVEAYVFRQQLGAISEVTVITYETYV